MTIPERDPSSMGLVQNINKNRMLATAQQMMTTSRPRRALFRLSPRRSGRHTQERSQNPDQLARYLAGLGRRRLGRLTLYTSARQSAGNMSYVMVDVQ